MISFAALEVSIFRAVDGNDVFPGAFFIVNNTLWLRTVINDKHFLVQVSGDAECRGGMYSDPVGVITRVNLEHTFGAKPTGDPILSGGEIEPGALLVGRSSLGIAYAITQRDGKSVPASHVFFLNHPAQSELVNGSFSLAYLSWELTWRDREGRAMFVVTRN